MGRGTWEMRKRADVGQRVKGPGHNLKAMGSLRVFMSWGRGNMIQFIENDSSREGQ